MLIEYFCSSLNCAIVVVGYDVNNSSDEWQVSVSDQVVGIMLNENVKWKLKSEQALN